MLDYLSRKIWYLFNIICFYSFHYLFVVLPSNSQLRLRCRFRIKQWRHLLLLTYQVSKTQSSITKQVPWVPSSTRYVEWWSKFFISCSLCNASYEVICLVWTASCEFIIHSWTTRPVPKWTSRHVSSACTAGSIPDCSTPTFSSRNKP